jgi:hypothetical protein
LSDGTCRAARGSPRGGSEIWFSDCPGRLGEAGPRDVGASRSAADGEAADEAVETEDEAAELAGMFRPARGAIELEESPAESAESVESVEAGSHQRGGRTSAWPVERTGARTAAASARRIATGRPVEAANRSEDSAMTPS